MCFFGLVYAFSERHKGRGLTIPWERPYALFSSTVGRTCLSRLSEGVAKCACALSVVALAICNEGGKEKGGVSPAFVLFLDFWFANGAVRPLKGSGICIFGDELSRTTLSMNFLFLRRGTF